MDNIKINFNLMDPNTYLDLVDPEDKVIGKSSKVDIYRSGLNNYRVVDVFLENGKGEVLILMRSAYQSIFPNCYDFSCGKHVFSGDSYEETAIRGLKEELNLTIQADMLIEIGYFNPRQTSSFCKLYKVFSNEIPNYDKKAFTSAQFISKKALKSMVEDTPEMFKGDLIKVVRLLF